MKQVRSLFSLSVGAVVHFASQRKTETTEGSSPNENTSSDGQSDVDPMIVDPVCISRDDRSRRQAPQANDAFQPSAAPTGIHVMVCGHSFNLDC